LGLPNFLANTFCFFKQLIKEFTVEIEVGSMEPKASKNDYDNH